MLVKRRAAVCRTIFNKRYFLSMTHYCWAQLPKFNHLWPHNHRWTNDINTTEVIIITHPLPPFFFWSAIPFGRVKKVHFFTPTSSKFSLKNQKCTSSVQSPSIPSIHHYDHCLHQHCFTLSQSTLTTQLQLSLQLCCWLVSGIVNYEGKNRRLVVKVWWWWWLIFHTWIVTDLLIKLF